MPHDRIGDRGELFQLADLAAQARGFERAVGDEQQPIGLERLLDEIVSAVLDGGDRGLDIAVPGNHDDRQFRMQLLDGAQKLQAVEAAALQPDVEKHEVRAPGLDRGERGIAVTCRSRGKSLILENARDQFANVGLVVDDQYIGCHA